MYCGRMDGIPQISSSVLAMVAPTMALEETFARGDEAPLSMP